MFRTIPDYEFKMPIPSEAFGGQEGTRHWRAFEIVAHKFWFIGEFLFSHRDADDDEMLLWHTFAADDVRDLIVLASEDVVREHRLNLVIPTYHDKDGRFRLMPIKEIYQGTEGGYRQTATIYVTSDGARFIDPSHDLQEADITNKALIYLKRDVNVRPNMAPEDT